MFLSSFSNKLIKSEWNALQLIIFKVKHTWNNFFARQEMQKKIDFFQNQNDTCAHLFTLVMKFYDRQSSERCIRKLIKDEVLLTVSCPIFPSILIAKNLLTGSLKNRSIDNLETQKKSISMKNSQFFDYLLYAKSK